MYLWSHLTAKEKAYAPSVYKKLILVSPPPFAPLASSSRLPQIYAVVWKQKWLHNSPDQRSVLFQMVVQPYPPDLICAAV
jgi:hypothetical protein